MLKNKVSIKFYNLVFILNKNSFLNCLIVWIEQLYISSLKKILPQHFSFCIEEPLKLLSFPWVFFAGQSIFKAVANKLINFEYAPLFLHMSKLFPSLQMLKVLELFRSASFPYAMTMIIKTLNLSVYPCFIQNLTN